MLDVHPPHSPTHTWKDFFIHVATICVGLLIAVGLEQTVEYFHHRHLASEAREQLSAERDQNQIANDFNIFATNLHQKYLHRDLAVLHAIRDHTPVAPVPFILRHARYLYLEDEWRKVHESGTVMYIHGNLQPTDFRYDNQEAFTARAERSTEDLSRAAAALRSENDPLKSTIDSNIAFSNFLKAIESSHETLSGEIIDRGFADSAEPGDVSKLTQVQRDKLEQAIQVALVDDDALLAYCFTIKRNMARNPKP